MPFYYREDDQVRGPIPLSAIQTAVKAGRLPQDTLVSTRPDGPWGCWSQEREIKPPLRLTPRQALFFWGLMLVGFFIFYLYLAYKYPDPPKSAEDRRLEKYHEYQSRENAEKARAVRHALDRIESGKRQTP